MRTIRGPPLSALVAAIAWFTVGHRTLDKVNESNVRSGGGGPEDQRVVSEHQLTPIVAKLRARTGREARLVSVTLRPDSVEFEVLQNGRARGYRWRRGHEQLDTFEVG